MSKLGVPFTVLPAVGYTRLPGHFFATLERYIARFLRPSFPFSVLPPPQVDTATRIKAEVFARGPISCAIHSTLPFENQYTVRRRADFTGGRAGWGALLSAPYCSS